MRNNNICRAVTHVGSVLCQAGSSSSSPLKQSPLPAPVRALTRVSGHPLQPLVGARAKHRLSSWLLAASGALWGGLPAVAALLMMVMMVPMTAAAGRIVLIIDDIGNKAEDIQAFELPSEVAFAILPHTPYSTPFARLAEQQQREVMLHIPMEALSGKSLGPGALLSTMHPDSIKLQLALAHKSVPNAIAVNNHMGSKLTQLTLPMTATMEYLQAAGLYFVDSRTTRFSRAEDIAQKHGVPTLHRHVFLDHFPEPKHIDMQFKRLRNMAVKYGQAVGIAHPYPQTLNYLQLQLPELRHNGIELVTLSELLRAKQLALTAARAERPARSTANICKHPLIACEEAGE